MASPSSVHHQFKDFLEKSKGTGVQRLEGQTLTEHGFSIYFRRGRSSDWEISGEQNKPFAQKYWGREFLQGCFAQETLSPGWKEYDWNGNRCYIWSDIDSGWKLINTVRCWGIDGLLPFLKYDGSQIYQIRKTQALERIHPPGWWNFVDIRDFDQDGDTDFCSRNQAETIRIILRQERPVKNLCKRLWTATGSMAPGYFWRIYTCIDFWGT